MPTTNNQKYEEKYSDLPDAEVCKAKEVIGVKGYELVDCLIERPFCKHSLAFGYRYLCRHPRRMDIVERTKAALVA